MNRAMADRVRACFPTFPVLMLLSSRASKVSAEENTDYSHAVRLYVHRPLRTICNGRSGVLQTAYEPIVSFCPDLTWAYAVRRRVLTRAGANEHGPEG